MGSDAVRVRFTESQTLWRRVWVPMQSGGAFGFDLPQGWGPSAFSAVFEQAARDAMNDYFRTHRWIGDDKFAEMVQGRIGLLAGSAQSAKSGLSPVECALNTQNYRRVYGLE